jgi:hypothetical protein
MSTPSRAVQVVAKPEPVNARDELGARTAPEPPAAVATARVVVGEPIPPAGGAVVVEVVDDAGAAVVVGAGPVVVGAGAVVVGAGAVVLDATMVMGGPVVVGIGVVVVTDVAGCPSDRTRAPPSSVAPPVRQAAVAGQVRPDIGPASAGRTCGVHDSPPSSLAMTRPVGAAAAVAEAATARLAAEPPRSRSTCTDRRVRASDGAW